MRHPQLAHLKSFANEPIVFLTVVTNQRRPLLANIETMETLRAIWISSLKKNGWAVGDFLLMPDHLHLFARAARTADPLAVWMKMWKSVSARKLLALQKTTAPFWQKDYFDRFLRSGENYSEKWAYVAANPVRANLCKIPDAWPFKGQIHPLHF